MSSEYARPVGLAWSSENNLADSVERIVFIFFYTLSAMRSTLIREVNENVEKF